MIAIKIISRRMSILNYRLPFYYFDDIVWFKYNFRTYDDFREKYASLVEEVEPNIREMMENSGVFHEVGEKYKNRCMGDFLYDFIKEHIPELEAFIYDEYLDERVDYCASIRQMDEAARFWEKQNGKRIYFDRPGQNDSSITFT